MADFSKETVLNVAKLAKIALTDAEAERFAGQLQNILGYVDILNEVDTTGVAPLSQTTGLETVLEADDAKAPLAHPDDLLKCTELPVSYRQIKVPTILPS